jgi:DNA invertase Pin-like site-specific DNA recombinase
VERRGGVIVASHSDDGRIDGRGKYAGWRTLLKHLERIDQVVVGNASDLPGQKVQDLLKILDLFRHHGVSIYLDREGIDTGAGPAAVLDLITIYRYAKLSAAIKSGQKRARTQGKVIGRPAIPNRVRRCIMADIASGFGPRAVARKHHVSRARSLTFGTRSREPTRKSWPHDSFS